MNLRLREFEYIQVIAEEGSINRAAKKLFIAQPSLTQALNKIEEQIGVKLFIRAKNNFKLTYEGELFVEAAKKISVISQELEDKLKSSSNLIRGRVVLGISYFLGAFMLPRFSTIFHNRFPLVDLHVVEETATTLEKMAANGVIDLAILPMPIKNRALCTKPFHTSRMVLMLPANHELNQYAYQKASGERYAYIDIRKTDGQPYLLNNKGQRNRDISELIFKKAGIAPDIIFSSGSIETIKRISDTGVGLTIIPEYYLDQLGPISGACCYYLEPEFDFPWTMAVAYCRERYLSSAAQKLIQVLVESL
ncbi:MAG: LysR family transcriptional regulator [Bacillota bacterium]